jgi:hypothetical protein
MFDYQRVNATKNIAMDDCQSLGNFAWPSILIMRYHEVDLIYFFSAVRYWLLFMVFECSSAQVCMFVKVLPECATWPHTHVDTAGRDRDKSHRAWMLTTKDAAYTKVAWLRFTHTRMRQAKMYRTVCTWCLWDQPNWKQDLTLFLTFCKNGGIPGKTWHPLTVFFHNDIYQQILRCMQCTFADTSSLFSGISVCQYYLHPKKCPYFPIELQSSLGIIRPWAGPTWWPPIAMSPPLYRCLITATMESQKRVSPQAIGLWYDLVKFSIFSKPDPSGFYRGQKETNSNSQMTCSLRKSIQVKNHGDHSGF